MAASVAALCEIPLILKVTRFFRPSFAVSRFAVDSFHKAGVSPCSHASPLIRAPVAAIHQRQ